MRILIDLQCCQSDSRFGGIGRYSMSLAKAMLRLPSAHQFGFLLNASLPNENFIRAEFEGLLPQQDIHTFVLPPFIAADNDLPAHTRMAELIREKRIAEIAPDVLHIASLFEGAGENVVTSVGLLFPAERTAVTLYDLIPFLEQETYLSGPVLADHYLRKFAQLREVGALVSISEFSRLEALEHTGVSPDRIVNISSAVDGQFAPRQIEEPGRTELLRKWGIDKPFVMFTGSFDVRKNHVRLVKSFARVLPTLAEPVQLVIVGKGLPLQVARLKAIGRYHGLSEGDLVFVGHVTDAELVALYNLARLFVFPSLREGFGLPVLEAMSCGVPTIGANRTSVPEVIARPDALFDPISIEDMAGKLQRVLTDDTFRDELRRHGLERAKHFSWRLSASKAVEAFERLHASAPGRAQDEAGYTHFLAAVSDLKLGPASAEFLETAAHVVAINELQGRVDAGTFNEQVRLGWVAAYNANSAADDDSSWILGALPSTTVRFEVCPERDPPLGEALASAPIDVVMIEAGRGGFDMSALAILVMEQQKLGRDVFVTFHSTEDLARVGAGSVVGVRAALKSCTGIFVHSMTDVSNLEKFNVRRNVSYIPAVAPGELKDAGAPQWSKAANWMLGKMTVALASRRGQAIR